MPLKKTVYIFILMLCSGMFLLSNRSFAATSYVPDELKPWQDWVLKGHLEELCTPGTDNSSHFCKWSGPLRLDLNDKGGIFEQEWTIETEGWIFLPGSEHIWPHEVSANGQMTTTVIKDKRPAIYIKNPGKFAIKGRFRWNNLPESILLPEENANTGSLVINGKRHDYPYISKGRIWLKEPAETPGEKDNDIEHIDIQVFRKITDSIPMFIETRIKLYVSGQSREVLLGWQTPANQSPFSLSSKLPVKLDDNRRIVVKVRPGKWLIRYITRINTPVSEIPWPKDNVGLWPGYEYWVFEAKPSLRVVSISGVSAIDPSMTDIPGNWRSLPAYLVKPGETMLIEEKKRGDAGPRPNQIELKRNIWLDEDGKNFTILDHLKGTVTKSWRIDAAPPMHPGRVNINGVDILITALTPHSPPGVEVRMGGLSMDAVSRMENSGVFRVAGWLHDMKKVEATLNLPPGWRLFHAEGVDRTLTWISQWTLFDVFIVLIFFLAVARLYGWLKAAPALAAMVLIYHEPGAPVMIWLLLLAATALTRVAPGHKFTRFAKAVHYITAAFILMLIIPFSIQQIRHAIYPQLEHGSYRQAATPGRPLQIMDETADKAVKKGKAVKRKMYKVMRTEGEGSPAPSPRYSSLYGKRFYEPDVEAMVQTGPGLPSWKWKEVRLYWNGPVNMSQEMRLYLISPLMNLILKITGVILLYLTAFFLMAEKGVLKKIRGSSSHVMTVMLLCLLFFSARPSHASAFPPENLLNELKERLLEPAACFPDCASFETMSIKITDRGEFNIRVDAGAMDEVAVPLPRSEQWHLADVRTDHKNALLFRHDKDIYTRLVEGKHQIEISGKVRGNTLRIFLPMKPHYVEVEADKWEVAGLDPNGVPAQQLQLQRMKALEKNEEISEPESLPAFLKVERTIHLGIKWHIETLVERLSPAGSPVIVDIPLIPGESVTSDNIEVKQGKVRCSMRPDQRIYRWHSILKETDHIHLKAPDTDKWTEEWELDAGMPWHVDINGIPAVYQQYQSRLEWYPKWHPWPGEELNIKISRPAAVKGATRTIDSSILRIKPGLRITEASLDMTLRSSKGENMTISIPDKATLESVTIDSKSRSIKQSGRKIVIPVHPGSQEIKITWREKRGITSWFKAPEVDLGIKSVNNTIEITPVSRWIWFLKGPSMGPAILFYSELAILFAAALLLGMSGITPIRTWQWMLLAAGLSQSGLEAGGIVAVWLLALGLRGKYGHKAKNTMFNLMQIGLILLTFAALCALAYAIQNGLLGQPDMKLAGNGSTSHLLRWYSDHAGHILPKPGVFSFSIIIYRITMLAWALWLAWNLLNWLRWGWSAFSNGRLWADFRLRRKNSQNETSNSEITRKEISKEKGRQ